MRRTLLLFAAALGLAAPAYGQTTVKVAWCGPVVTTAAAPYAIAQKMGWFAEGGIKVQLFPLPGSTDCVKQVATGELLYSMPSIEPLAIIRPQGVKAKNFYTAYQSNIYGLAVAAESPIKTFQDLRGKSIGVTSMASAGVVIARALVADAGLNPDTDVRIVVAGEGAQSAALLRGKQVDALSQFDAAYALIENAGVKLRMLDNSKIERFPSNGLVALEKTLAERRPEAVALARGIAMGTLFMHTNPEASVRVMFEVYPQTKPTGKDDETALSDGLRPLKARLHAWDLASGGATKYGENIIANYQAYLDFLLKWGVLKQAVPVNDLVTNDLVDDANKFDAAKVREAATNYR
ncbi:MAG: ABC transporter substrate-binding protein [Acetobacteraceae bacterium]